MFTVEGKTTISFRLPIEAKPLLVYVPEYEIVDHKSINFSDQNPRLLSHRA